MLASDDNNPEFVNPKNPDAALGVTFFNRTLPDNFKSEKQGKAVFFEEAWVRIMIPGRTDLTVEEPVTEVHKKRFAREWAMFVNNESPDGTGTPVDQWSEVSKEHADYLKGQKFHTVEQIAYCSDAQLQAVGMNAATLRQKARAHVAAKGNGAAREEMKRRDEENAELRKEVSELKSLMHEFLTAANKPQQQQQAKR